MKREEIFWRRFFAAAPAGKLSRPVWPGVLVKIREQKERKEAFSAAILLFGRRLAPAFALFLLLAGGAALWLGNASPSPESDPVAVAWAGPETVLNQWAGVADE